MMIFLLGDRNEKMTQAKNGRNEKYQFQIDVHLIVMIQFGSEMEWEMPQHTHTHTHTHESDKTTEFDQSNIHPFKVVKHTSKNLDPIIMLQWREIDPCIYPFRPVARPDVAYYYASSIFEACT